MDRPGDLLTAVDCRHKVGPACGLGLYGGRPSAGVCGVCRRRESAGARGLGDTVARVLDATGVGPLAKGAIERVTGKPCGCASRQAKLNALVPYG